MKLIVISNMLHSEHEVQHVESLFANGLETYHLRKPEQTEKEFEKTLRSIPAIYYKRIVIHSHYKLIEKYNLKGIHLTEHFMKSVTPESLKMIVTTVHKRNLTVSASFHDTKALGDLQLKLDYVFLGPVFDSISKSGYTSRISLDEVSLFTNEIRRNYLLFALGGIEANNVSKLKSAGFDGAALLGAIWQSGLPHENYLQIKNLSND